MPLFRKPPPPLWYVLYPPRNPAREEEPKREGPYTRASIIELHAQGRLSHGALVWTNERIFPNPRKPRAARLVHIHEWRRLDQLPDPVFREIDRAAAAARAAIHAVHTAPADHQVSPPPPPSPDELARLRRESQSPAPGPDAPGPDAPGLEAPGLDGGGEADATAHPPAAGPGASVFPAGAHKTVDNASGTIFPAGAHDTLHRRSSTQQSGHLPAAFPPPAAYPQPGVYPQSAPPPQ